jgi:hypothetical protein
MPAPDTLLLKILLVPALIAAVTIVGRRYGQGIGGWLGSFPIVAGPVLFILALENGVTFGAESAEAALLAVAPAMVFYVVYARLALRASWPFAAAVAVVIWFVVTAMLAGFDLPLALVLLVVVAALWWSGRALSPQRIAAGQAVPAALTPHRLELPARMLTGAAVTLVTSELGKQGGAELGGYASLFPSIGLVVASFNHAQAGPLAAIHFLRGMTRGMWSVASFCLALVFGLPAFGLSAGFLLAVSVAVATHAITRPRRAAFES